jgi:hypothetical protein
MKLTNYIRDAFVTAAMQDVPKIKYDEQIQKLAHDDAVSQMQPIVRSAYCAHPEWFNHCRKWMVNSIIVRVPSPESTEIRFTEAAQKEIDELIAKSREQEAQHDKLRSHLKALAYGCTTRKALAEALPEFEKYLPAEEPKATRNLPAIANLVADFTKAGWPKTKGATA